ncbi:hypothetical protein FNFX1_0787 [Francisella cf. novicida Fx1]|uniref:hypothetical protein n=1 Tax=Francisella tularensis TaxID=263 RepID=UPI0002059006|nr:hypothetical protein FNFX1_0787 [Francisella cf. novicida Fx1]
MKKLILTSILGFIFAAPAFSFDNPNDGSDSTKVTSNVTNMSNTVPRDANVVQQPIPRDSVRNMQSHRQIINQRNKQQVSQMTKRHLGGISEENLQSPRVTKKDLKQNPSDNNSAKQLNNSKNDTRNIDKDKDDENPNLANLATPEPTNIRNNLMISDEDRSLNRQMMINGPQGGFQNNQPRGIGGTSANL